MLPSGLTPEQIATEMTKWQRAHEFSEKTGSLDIAYDGFFFQQNVDSFCAITAVTEPDWAFMDDEAYGDGWESWRVQVSESANAQARAKAGESTDDLAWRMVLETMKAWTACLKPKTTVGWYGSPFPDGVFSGAGISMQPSVYGAEHYLKSYAGGLRNSKLRQSPMAGGKPRHLLPWLTACTYGQMTATSVLDGALHSFGAGATGFSFFIDSCFDDMAKLLALSTAVALATPFETLIMHGNPVLPIAAVGFPVGLRAWSGVTNSSDVWLVLTPGDHGRTELREVELDLVLEDNAHESGADNGVAEPWRQLSFSACNLMSGQVQQSVGVWPTLKIHMQLRGTTVLHLSGNASADCEKNKLPPSAWTPSSFD